jgi:hypothetical protein
MIEPPELCSHPYHLLDQFISADFLLTDDFAIICLQFGHFLDTH